jgi:nucleotide-binding universal stress UspA family protein
METIVCATRGGEASRRAQDKAIELAKARGARLIFLNVADMEFMSDTAAPLVVDVQREMVRMGEFMLLMAQERAEEQGVTAETIVCPGRVRHVIITCLQEVGATTLVLGRPHPKSQARVFDEAEVDPFAEFVRTATGVEVVTV